MAAQRCIASGNFTPWNRNAQRPRGNWSRLSSGRLPIPTYSLAAPSERPALPDPAPYSHAAIPRVRFRFALRFGDASDQLRGFCLRT
jgi:hypothetical protein